MKWHGLISFEELPLWEYIVVGKSGNGESFAEIEARGDSILELGMKNLVTDGKALESVHILQVKPT